MVAVDDIDFEKTPLVPAIVRDARSGEVLTLAWMNRDALALSIESGESWFWSRSRGELWNKGATSGNRQKIVSIARDCDGDALLIDVVPAGPACHRGTASCFDAPRPAVAALIELLQSRRATMPERSYSAEMFRRGAPAILRKIGEETTEVLLAATTETRERLVSEVADLTFHLLLLLVEQGIDPGEIVAELESRSGGAG